MDRLPSHEECEDCATNQIREEKTFRRLKKAMQHAIYSVLKNKPTQDTEEQTETTIEQTKQAAHRVLSHAEKIGWVR